MTIQCLVRKRRQRGKIGRQGHHLGATGDLESLTALSPKDLRVRSARCCWQHVRSSNHSIGAPLAVAARCKRGFFPARVV